MCTSVIFYLYSPFALFLFNFSDSNDYASGQSFGHRLAFDASFFIFLKFSHFSRVHRTYKAENSECHELNVRFLLVFFSSVFPIDTDDISFRILW